MRYAEDSYREAAVVKLGLISSAFLAWQSRRNASPVMFGIISQKRTKQTPEDKIVVLVFLFRRVWRKQSARKEQVLRLSQTAQRKRQSPKRTKRKQKMNSLNRRKSINLVHT